MQLFMQHFNGAGLKKSTEFWGGVPHFFTIDGRVSNFNLIGQSMFKYGNHPKNAVLNYCFILELNHSFTRQ